MDEISDAFVLLAEQDDFLHSLLHFNLGLHHVMLGNTGLAIDSFAETLRLTKTLNNPLVSIVAQVQMGETRQIRGALGLAERTFQQVIQYARETLGEHTFLLGMPFISYADLLREQNRFDEAIRYAEQGIAYCQVWQPVASMDGQIALARLNAAQGHWDEAFARLEHAMQVAETSVSVLDDTFVAIHGSLESFAGRSTQSRALIKVYDLEKASEGMYFHLWEMTQLVLLRAKVQTLQTDPEPAPVDPRSFIHADSGIRTPRAGDACHRSLDLARLCPACHRTTCQTPPKVCPMRSRSAHKADTSASLPMKASNSCICSNNIAPRSMPHAPTLTASSIFSVDEGLASPVCRQSHLHVNSLHPTHPPRTRHPATPRCWQKQPGNRRGTCADLEHGQETCGKYFVQDWALPIAPRQ